MNRKIFREYDIRGVADTDLDSALVIQIGRAIGSRLARQGGHRVAVGRDCRLSTERLFQALTEGIQATGITLVDIGLVPTPLLYFAAATLRVDGGVMITGSHNPPEHNGLKMVLQGNTLYGDAIQDLLGVIERNDFEKGSGSRVQESVLDSYIATIKKQFRQPLNVTAIVDSGNGMGGIVAPELYRALGCRITELFSEPDGRFPHHHPDPTQPENLSDITAALKHSDALVGIAFDGDADRIGAVDPSGKALFGDELLVLYARALLESHPGATVIADVKASGRLFRDVERHGGKGLLWKTGHSLIKAKMKETKALLAGEMSGHMFFADRYYGFDDAIYAGCRLLEIIDHHQKSPMELLCDLPPAISTPELRLDCADDKKFPLVEACRNEFIKMGLRVNAIDGARVEFEDGWGLVRASNTQPVLVQRFEANSKERLEAIQSLVQKVVERCLKNL